MKTIMVTSLLAILALIGSHRVSAQDRPQQGPAAGRDRDVRTTTATDGKLDSQLANCLAIDNWVEIELAKFAENKSQSEEVKRFTQTLQRDHAQFVSRLQEIEPTIQSAIKNDPNDRVTDRRTNDTDRRTNDTDRPTNDTNRPTNDTNRPTNDTDRPTNDTDRRTNETDRARETAPQTSGQTTTGRRDPNATAVNASDQRFNAEGQEMLRIKQEIAQACVSTFKEELGGKSAADFDRCYLGQQVVAHLHLLDTLKVFERHASPQLAQAINDAKGTTQQHLEHAKTLLTQHESKLSRTDNANPVNVK